MKTAFLPVLALLALSPLCDTEPASGTGTGKLRCEYLEDPLGIDMAHPRFSWVIRASSNGVLQSAYEVMVSRRDPSFSEPSIVWNPGKVPSAKSVNVPYEGSSLESQTTYYWRVRIWDQEGMESGWSKTAMFHTGYLDGDAIPATWIMSPDGSMRSPLMRRELDIGKAIESAFVYATAIGLYELYLNGSKVGDRLLEPATTQYTERLLYSVYDVSGQITAGDNVIGVWMGEGQSAYSIPPESRFHNINMRVPVFERPMMLLELRVNYADGSHEIFGSDTCWKFAASPMTFNNYFGGEDYDARLELPGWSAPGFDDSGWRQVTAGEYRGRISAQLLQPVREGRVYEPVASVQRDARTIDFDFGTTIGGYWEIEVEGEAGTRVMIRGTEKCGSDAHQKALTGENRLNWESNHTGKFFYRDCWSIYTLKGEGREVYKPRFFYQGHRYVQVRLSDPDRLRVIRLNNIEVGHAVDAAGRFECSDEYLNRLHGMIVQTFKNNLVQGVPLSNPNSEKYGWTGDVHLFSEAADYTYDLAAFWTKWLQDFPDAQGWAGASGLIPVTVPELRVKRHIVSDVTWLAVYPFLLRQMYRHCQDRELIRAHYGPLKKWVQHILDVSDGLLADGVWGDHLIPGEGQQSLGASRGMTRLLNTAYLYRISGIMAAFAGILGLDDDVAYFKDLASGVYNAFNGNFFDDAAGIYLESPSPEGFYYELTSNLVPLQMGLVPEERKQAILDFVVDHITSMEYRAFTGILGTKAMVDVLQEAGAQECLYRIVRNTDFPGWGYTIEQLGASTLNQNWNGKGDYNHCMFGSIDEFMYNDLLGIKFDFSGEEKVVRIEPYLPEDLSFARGKANSLYGTVESGWEKMAGGTRYSFAIPHNTTGVFGCSIGPGEHDILINGQPLVRNKHTVSIDGNRIVLMMGSGKYDVSVIKR